MNKTIETSQELIIWYENELQRIDKEATDLNERLQMTREINTIRNKYMEEILAKERKETTKEMIYSALLNTASYIDDALGTEIRINLLLKLPM